MTKKIKKNFFFICIRKKYNNIILVSYLSIIEIKKKKVP